MGDMVVELTLIQKRTLDEIAFLKKAKSPLILIRRKW
jgi:hypothetical protein